MPETARYTEGLFVGYRYYDEHSIAFSTGYPFGHGLSYTTFSYSHATLDGNSREVQVDVKNTGDVSGAEVAQLYLGFPKEAGEPPKVLRGFQKTQVLPPGNTETVTFALPDHAFEVWDAEKHAWRAVKGDFKVMIGSSSRDIRTTLEMKM